MKIPTLEKPNTYLLNCMFFHGGENHINLLMTTNVDLEQLLKNDIADYIRFVQSNLVKHFCFANYSGDFNITTLMDIDRELDEDLEVLINRAIASTPNHELEIMIENCGIDIEIGGDAPSSFKSFQLVPSSEIELAKKYIHKNYVFDCFITA